MQRYTVKEVRTIGPLRLKVRFEDGLDGEVHLKESHLKGVFERLRDPAFFNNCLLYTSPSPRD